MPEYRKSCERHLGKPHKVAKYIKSKTPLKRSSKRIASMSKKRQRDYRQYAKLRREFLALRPYCQRQGCGKRATEIHHWAGRGKNYLNQNTWRASCHDCNMFAKDCPAFARDEGWIAPAGQYAC